MLCDKCKENKANLHFTKIINGNKQEMNLCEKCALENQDLGFDKLFSFHKLFTGLFDNMEEVNIEDDIRCSTCNLSFSQFKRTGKFGCSDCYDEFKDYLNPIIKGVQGHLKHKGKVPKRIDSNISLKREVKLLNDKLEDAIKAEEFEEAAALRDKIKQIKEMLQRHEEGLNGGVEE